MTVIVIFNKSNQLSNYLINLIDIGSAISICPLTYSVIRFSRCLIIYQLGSDQKGLFQWEQSKLRQIEIFYLGQCIV